MNSGLSITSSTSLGSTSEVSILTRTVLSEMKSTLKRNWGSFSYPLEGKSFIRSLSITTVFVLKAWRGSRL